ncbi:hypothetical protein ALP75_200912 [Pseudomonas syringae pv. actinidiae]|nr:hypothetical protein ALP75_200912 [Pseudomonas syringae pv. actinidiae]
MNAGGRAGADGHLPGDTAGVTGQLQQGVLDQGVYARDMFQQCVARRGRLEAFTHALDQFQVQAGFQLSHLQADCRLGQVQVLCGCGKAAMRDDQ